MTDERGPICDDPKRQGNADLFLMWWAFVKADAELSGRGIDDNDLILSFVGSGSSVQVFAKDLDAVQASFHELRDLR